MSKINSFTFFDVETPNSRNNSICQIGILTVVNGKINERLNILVNPEDDFDSFNSSIHGLTKHMVKDQPNFKDVWQNISEYFNGVIVAHNAAFDVSVLAKCLDKYDIDIPIFSSICTMKLAKGLLSETYTGRYTLDQLCNYYNIDIIKHHDAYSDVLSCYQLFSQLTNTTGLNIKKYIKMERPSVTSIDYKSRLSEPQLRKSISHFYGLIIGMTADSIIDDLEIIVLEKWVYDNKQYQHIYPFDAIIEKIESILSDHIVTSEEMVSLLQLVISYTQSKAYAEDTVMLMVLQGIITGISVDNNINAQEIKTIYHWLEENKHLEGNYPFDNVFSLLKEVIHDQIITECEYEELTGLFNQFVDPIKELNKGLIKFEEKTFCLTGEFEMGPKSLVESIIQSRGGRLCKSVIKKLDYLIVGGVGSDRWSFGSYGGKVKKALELQEGGSMVLVINETSFTEQVNKKV